MWALTMTRQWQQMNKKKTFNNVSFKMIQIAFAHYFIIPAKAALILHYINFFLKKDRTTHFDAKPFKMGEDDGKQIVQCTVRHFIYKLAG